MSKPLAKLDGAFELIRTSVDPGWWAVALLIAVMLGGFGWLSGQISRMGARVDAVSLKVAETPGLFQRELQAQTEKLAALINADRQSRRAAPLSDAVGPTQGGAPASRPGVTNGANTTTAGSNSTAITGNRRRPGAKTRTGPGFGPNVLVAP